MILVEKHIITSKHSLFSECERVCFSSKNVYNSALYAIRNHFFETSKFLGYKETYKIIKEQECYKELARNSSQQTIMMVDKSFKSFFNALKSYRLSPKKFSGLPKIPKYKDSKDGRFLATYTTNDMSRKSFKKESLIKLTQTNIKFHTKIKDFVDIKQVRIVPRNNLYVIEVIYKKQEEVNPCVDAKYASIDMGVNNLATIAQSDLKNPIIINGKPLKSINQYYNKKKALLQSQLKKKRYKSERIEKLTNKRNNKINDYLHKASRLLVNHLVSNQITSAIIGKNVGWKQDVNIGRKNNQNFVNIPHARFIDMVTYKCNLVGISVVVTEEWYTSKCSFLDLEDIKKQKTYLGKREKRGLFRASCGRTINADVNGSYNIMRKVVPNVFDKGIEGVVVHPYRLGVCL